MKQFAAATVLVGALALAPAGALAQQERQDAQASGKGKSAQQGQRHGEFDMRFIDMTIAHHEMGIKMSRLAEQKAENAGLKAKAAEIGRAQQHDIDELQQMRERLYPDAPEPRATSGTSGNDMGSMRGHAAAGEANPQHHAEQQARPTSGATEGAEKDSQGDHRHGDGGMEQAKELIERLEKLDGEEFDREFAKEMIRHHEMQVRMSEQALNQVRHDEVRDFAQKSVDDHKMDIEHLKKFAGPAAK